MMKVTTLLDASQGLKFTESPRWHKGELWFLDIHDRRIKKVSVDGAVETVLELPFLPNSLGFRPDGSMIFGDGLNRLIYTWNGKEYHQLADISHLAKICLSDGIADAQGRLYVGDIGYNFLGGAEPSPEGVIVMVRTDGQAAIAAENLFFPNGMVITPDGKTLIVAETLGHCLTAFDIQEDGTLDNRRTFAQLPGKIGVEEGVLPDGICLDAEGAVWVATAGTSVVRVKEGGEITQRIDLQNLSFAVMLGGTDRKTLFICTSHSHHVPEILQSPSARIEFVKTDIPGAGNP
jgi:sugar lactone lactonase YvrE